MRHVGDDDSHAGFAGVPMHPYAGEGLPETGDFGEDGGQHDEECKGEHENENDLAVE